MREHRRGPEESRDEADVINAIGHERAAAQNRPATGEDFEQAAETLDALRATSPTVTDAIIATRAGHERAQRVIGPERLEAVRALERQIEAAVSNHLIEFRKRRPRYQGMNRQAYAELVVAEIESALQHVVDPAEADSANVALFADQGTYRSDWWQTLRERLQRSAERELLGP
jgi:hypothetical protein